MRIHKAVGLRLGIEDWAIPICIFRFSGLGQWVPTVWPAVVTLVGPPEMLPLHDNLASFCHSQIPLL